MGCRAKKEVRKNHGNRILDILGLIAGALAKLIMPGRDPGGIIVTILIGIAGAIIGGIIVTALGGPGVTGVNVASIIVAIVGAIILLAIYRLITGNRRSYGTRRRY